MFECKTFISVREIKEMLCVSESKAYSIVRDLNKELEDKLYGQTAEQSTEITCSFCSRIF